MSFLRRKRFWWLAAGLTLAGLAAISWQGIVMGIAASSSERPPELLTDFDWPDQRQSQSFADAFPAGSNEAELLAWLEAEEFEIAPNGSAASRRYSGIPCTYGFDVSWSSESGLLDSDARAAVSEYGCL